MIAISKNRDLSKPSCDENVDIPNSFVWGLSSPVAKKWNWHRVKEVEIFWNS